HLQLRPVGRHGDADVLPADGQRCRIGSDADDHQGWRSESHRQRAQFALRIRSEEHTSELQSRRDLVCRLLLEKKKKKKTSRWWSPTATYLSCLFHAAATTELYTLSLHDALPISSSTPARRTSRRR